MPFPFGHLQNEILPRLVDDAGLAAAVCHAQVRQGRAEHEWLQPESSPALRYECRSARMTVGPDRCLAASDGEVIEVDLVVARGHAFAELDILHRLPEGSWILVTDEDDRELMPAVVEGREQRTRIRLAAGAVRISARLGDGARLSVRVAPIAR